MLPSRSLLLLLPAVPSMSATSSGAPSSAPRPARVASPSPLPVGRSDGLTPAARRGAVAGVVAAHLVGAWGLLQIEAVRHAVAEVAPLMVDLVAPPAPPVPAVPPPPPPSAPPQLKKPPPQAALVAATPSPAPVVFEAPPPPVEPPAPIVAIDPPPAPPAPTAPAPQAKTVAITQVSYLTPPVLTYPATSKRFGESGDAQVRILVDAEGLPRQMQLIKSTGFQRLDDAALATVRATRFKPYTENGVPQPFWVVMPLVFELQR